MKKGILLILVVFILSAALVSASGSFSVSSSPAQSRIMINEEARFEITIENNLGTDDSFRIYYTDVEWGFSTEPRTDTTVFIKDGEKKVVTVILKPLYIGYGSHGIPLNVKSISTEKMVRHPVYVSIISLGKWSTGSPIAVRTDINMPKEINPKETLLIKVNLENQYAINISHLVLKAESSFFSVEKSFGLQPLETKEVDFEIPLNPVMAPQKSVVYFTLTSEGQIFKEVEKAVEVIAYATLSKVEGDPVKSFLKSEKKIIVTNDGNAKLESTVKTEAPPFAIFYVFSSPRGSFIKEESGKYLAWEIALEPQESATLTVTKSYRPLLILIIVVLISVLVYFIFRSPVVVAKEATQLKMEEGGGLSQIKVIVSIKNRTGSEVKNIKVLDRVPNLANIVKTFRVGSMLPTKILKHEKKGTIAKWFIESLEPGEERIIIYSLRARLTILGGFNLPPAIVKLRDNRGRDRITHSNKVFVRV